MATRVEAQHAAEASFQKAISSPFQSFSRQWKTVPTLGEPSVAITAVLNTDCFPMEFHVDDKHPWNFHDKKKITTDNIDKLVLT